MKIINKNQIFVRPFILGGGREGVHLYDMVKKLCMPMSTH